MKAILLTVSIIFISLMLTGINYADFGAENVMGVWLFNEGILHAAGSCVF